MLPLPNRWPPLRGRVVSRLLIAIVVAKHKE
jgi:hypothetical protein